MSVPSDSVSGAIAGQVEWNAQTYCYSATTEKICHLKGKKGMARMTMMSLANVMEEQQATTKEMEEKLQDVIACLSSELKNKELKVYQLEESFKDLKAENLKAIENFTKDMHELQNTHKFVTDNLRFQLANAEVQLRDIDEFREQKAAIEQEIASLKEQLEKEKKEHQDAISDTESTTIKFIHNSLIRCKLLHIVEDELAKRNLMNQRTIRILHYKFQGIHADKHDDFHRKMLVAERKDEDIHRKKRELEQIKIYIQEQTQAIDSVSGAEEAMRFLYACLDDIELETVTGAQERAVSPCVTDLEANREKSTELPCSLDQLTTVQRQKLLMNLLRTAVSIRAVAQNSAIQKPLPGAVSVEDILSLSVEGAHIDEVKCNSVSSRRVVSVGVQTDALNLEERLALEIKERLRPCSSLGVVA
ncbi:hypothetical protein L7F22_008645 [Adiantum nelumboides]|nr:hypothetical protein [Adiantum nelumboides]